ncbi:MAG: hypothetical protein ACOYOF_21690, partial [Verrucomicrobiaceae bacterium]
MNTNIKCAHAPTLSLPAFTAWLTALTILFSPLPTTAATPDLTIQKLYGRWTGTPTNYYLGSQSALASTEKWIMVGAPASDEGATDAGAVQVFNAVTGAWVRKLSP